MFFFFKESGDSHNHRTPGTGAVKQAPYAHNKTIRVGKGNTGFCLFCTVACVKFSLSAVLASVIFFHDWYLSTANRKSPSFTITRT